jgi:hypothetical protein
MNLEGIISSMSAKNNNYKGKQREVFEQAFNEIGGIDKLMSWALEMNEDGKLVNYGEFIKHYVKLVPPIKPDKEDKGETQESFIMGLIKAENILALNKGKPKQLIDVTDISDNDTIETQSH